jgi:hypothetical protein
MPVAVTVQNPISVRQLLAASAPAAPKWFVPAMPDPPARPQIPESLKPHERLVRDVWVGECELSDMPGYAQADARAWIEAMNIADHENELWCQRRDEQCLAQWPWVYADLVLAAEGGAR